MSGNSAATWHGRNWQLIPPHQVANGKRTQKQGVPGHKRGLKFSSKKVQKIVNKFCQSLEQKNQFLGFKPSFQFCSSTLIWVQNLPLQSGSAISYRREPKSCLGQVFNSKLGHIATQLSKCKACTQTLLELKTQTMVRPVT